MKILGIDTTTDILSLAIVESKKIIFDYMVSTPEITHSSMLVLSLREIMKITRVNINELGGIAVSIGPGSFTGLRVGLATAKGLAFSLSIPIIGVNSLDAYALRWNELPGILCPIIKARQDDYYFTFFKKEKNNDRLIRLEDYQCLDWMSINRIFDKYNEKIFVFGEGLGEVISDNQTKYFKEDKVVLVVREQEPPGARNIALMGQERLLQNKEDDVYKISPFYIKKSAAEQKRKELKIRQKDINQDD